MLAVLRRRNFALLWCGQLVFLIGNWVWWIGMPFYVYERTGSALAMGTMLIVNVLPSVLFGSLAGVFADRWDRKRTIVVATLIRAGAFVSLLAARSGTQMWAIYVVVFVDTLLAQFIEPSRNALFTRLVDEQQLVTSNSLNALGSNLAGLIGPALGGMLAGNLEL
jgi:MFS family permease